MFAELGNSDGMSKSQVKYYVSGLCSHADPAREGTWWGYECTHYEVIAGGALRTWNQGAEDVNRQDALAQVRRNVRVHGPAAWYEVSEVVSVGVKS